MLGLGAPGGLELGNASRRLKEERGQGEPFIAIQGPGQPNPAGGYMPFKARNCELLRVEALC